MALIDSLDFTDFTVLMGDYYGVHPHYLAAVAQLRSGITDDVVDDAFGPYRLSQRLWDENLHIAGFAPDYEAGDVSDWRSQCAVFARMSRRTLDGWLSANNGQTPSAIELYVSQLVADGRPPPGGDERTDLIAKLEDALLLTRPAIGKAREPSLEGSDQPVDATVLQEVVLFRRRPGSAPVRGHLIARMQAALVARGLLPATGQSGGRSDDGVFGPETERSLEAWQAATGHPSTGALTFGQWTELTEEAPPSWYDLCAQLTAAFEGTGFGGTNKTNFDGTILTFGYHGYTFAGGSLPKFLGMVDGSDPKLIDEAFGAKAHDLRRLCALPHETAVAQAPDTFLVDGGVDAGWRRAFLAFGSQPACQRLQLEFSRQEYWGPAERMRNVLRLSDGLSSALCFDVAVQNGPGTALASTVAGRYTGSESERERRTLMADAVTRQGRFSDDVRQRKQAISTGAGQVHGSAYDLADWGFADGESAEAGDATIKVLTPERNASFEAWFRSQMPDLVEFSSLELLTKGRQNESNHLNTDPPRELWPNILPTIRVLVALKRALGGAAITLNSVYRNPGYNKSVNGARDSQHMRFTATDIVVHDGSQPSRWAGVLHQMRSTGVFKGGIGLYPGFVHVDTRGFNTDWG